MEGVLIFDLQVIICKDDSLQRRDLYQLALTSKSWRHAATPVLWAELRGIAPLLRLMPEDAWQMRARPA
ncbi:hypothetical protein BD626DRAFT_501496 [Schizophyllum amplum]|uniref:F-box domain-containing protein n=1 Tax=Schizophyllum amplum TaxID=97359 RepID=A0A550C9V1_9AGAR|nr:hypothetical protein BD626DRAFT_501496 [Auriculariopsis ampla]